MTEVTGPVRVTVVEEFLELPRDLGGTRCRVSIAMGGNRRPVVMVSSAADNEGPSIRLAFDAIVAHVRSQLPEGGLAPIWLEHWPERAVAALLLHDQDVSATHVVIPHARGWRREPIAAREAARLMVFGSDNSLDW